MVTSGSNGSGARKGGRQPKSRATPSARDAGGRSTGASTQSPDSHIKLTIHSDHIASRDVQKRILDEVSRHGFNSQATFAIKLALEEAMINAIKHGNKFDANKQVHVQATISDASAEIIIEDQGKGFNREVVPDPTLEENIEKCSGRGILLMEAYMNTVEYSKKGRRLRMVKLNEPDVLPRK